MKNNQAWISPTHGRLTLEEIPQYIRDNKILQKLRCGSDSYCACLR